MNLQVGNIGKIIKEKKYILLTISVLVVILLILALILVKPFSPPQPKKKQQPLSSEEIRRIGFDLYRKGKYQQIVDKVEEYLKSNESDFQARSLLVSAYLALGQTKKAYEHTKYLHKLRKHDSFILFRLGNLADQLGKTSKAIEYLKKALAEEPNKLQYHSKIASLYSKSKMYEKALKEWEIVLQMLPKDALHRAQVYELIGDIYLDMKQPDKAKEAFQESLKIKPDDKEVSAKLNKLSQ